MWILSLFTALNAYRKFRKSMRELSTLDERALQDIGMTRSEVSAAAWERAWN